MLFISGEKKKVACAELDSFESQLGPAGMAQLVQCGGDFVPARKHALDACGFTGALDSNSKASTDTDNGNTCNEAMCNVAKARVRLFVCLHRKMTCNNV